MVEALLVNSPSGGCVEFVVTFATHLLDEGVDERGLMAAIACLEVQMLCKPIAREFRNLLKCPRLLKKVGSARHDRELLLTAQSSECLLIQSDNLAVIASNNQ